MTLTAKAVDEAGNQEMTPHVMKIFVDKTSAVNAPANARGAVGAYVLAQNYPNPFNPETTIRFYLNERQKVRLAIYDLAGHRVRTLVEGELAAGEQALSWDGRDEQGRPIASEVYFYELLVGNKVERRKMTLIR